MCTHYLFIAKKMEATQTPRAVKFLETESRMGWLPGAGQGDRELLFNVYGGSFLQDEKKKILQLLDGGTNCPIV